MKGAAAIFGGAAASSLLPDGLLPDELTASAAATVNGCDTTVAAGDSKAIVETTAGKVRGYVRNGIHTFKGIPYAATTAGEARFQPPTKAKPWAGVRSSMQYGFLCPQQPRTGWGNDEVAWMFDWDDGRPGEDCLLVNVWTPGVSSSIFSICLLVCRSLSCASSSAPCNLGLFAFAISTASVGGTMPRSTALRSRSSPWLRRNIIERTLSTAKSTLAAISGGR